MPSKLKVDQLTTTSETGDLSFVGSIGIDMSASTKGLVLPKGTTAQRPTSGLTAGLQRYNTDLKAIEYYTGTEWRSTVTTAASDNVVVGMEYKIWTTSFTQTTTYVYEKVPGSTLTFTTKETGSSFLLLQDMAVYIVGSSSGGSNGAFFWNNTLVGGAHQSSSPGVSNSSLSDSWMGGMHSGLVSSYNHKRIATYSPNLAAGTSVTVDAGIGTWGGGTNYVNYPGYDINSSMVVIEYKNR
jgi:hypothetical protein